MPKIKKTYRLSAINSNGEQFIVATEVSYNEQGLGTRRMAAQPVDPAMAQKLLRDCKENKAHIAFGAQNRQNLGVFTPEFLEGADPDLELVSPVTADIVTKEGELTSK